MAAPYPPVVLLLARLLECDPAACLVAGAGVHFIYQPMWSCQDRSRVIGLSPAFPERLWARLHVSFERHTAPEPRLTAIVHAAPRDHHLLLFARDRIFHLVELDLPHLIVDDGTGARPVPPEQVEEEWAQAMPAGVWYAVSRRPAELPSAGVLRAGLLQNAHEMLISSGAPQGVDGIELWGEALAAWPDAPEWPVSARATAAHIQETGGLWRHALAQALETLRPHLPATLQPAPLLATSVRLWGHVADGLQRAAVEHDTDALVAVRSSVLRLAGAESRLWHHVAEVCR
ncbi:MAG: DUF4872 domain-containing protein [Ardenticatenia bacterium]|nr:DUF4872 domain-containing protein [Ardenticatenia bacterium]